MNMTVLPPEQTPDSANVDRVVVSCNRTTENIVLLYGAPARSPGGSRPGAPRADLACARLPVIAVTAANPISTMIRCCPIGTDSRGHA